MKYQNLPSMPMVYNDTLHLLKYEKKTKRSFSISVYSAYHLKRIMNKSAFQRNKKFVSFRSYTIQMSLIAVLLRVGALFSSFKMLNKQAKLIKKQC